MGIREVQAALDVPNPIAGPDYVPWWAQGEYARKNGTSYTTESGITVKDGMITGRPQIAKERIERKAEPKPGVDIPDLTLPELCDKYNLSHDLYKTAPNGGVASMRVRNAIRKLLAA